MPDLTPDHVRLMLSMQGYSVPEIDLIEITARLNALIQGLTEVEQYVDLTREPWPTIVPTGIGNA